ncbi:hypothetical protein K458DRAFT_407279 [Lentithecium fluviatile CBS 122367]|uniref:Uncharacterized protein n=1 Tax=Lentithecium fluviatile CBS 122367 TaxID=1168545 RepID=A0A6G1IQL2_9PLEO|nr:hypothetical protein K458DRAFT_407279 [Lentithecium fluviatile CBS 122367]
MAHDQFPDWYTYGPNIGSGHDSVIYQTELIQLHILVGDGEDEWNEVSIDYLRRYEYKDNAATQTIPALNTALVASVVLTYFTATGSLAPESLNHVGEMLRRLWVVEGRRRVGRILQLQPVFAVAFGDPGAWEWHFCVRCTITLIGNDTYFVHAVLAV